MVDDVLPRFRFDHARLVMPELEMDGLSSA